MCKTCISKKISLSFQIEMLKLTPSLQPYEKFSRYLTAAEIRKDSNRSRLKKVIFAYTKRKGILNKGLTRLFPAFLCQKAQLRSEQDTGPGWRPSGGCSWVEAQPTNNNTHSSRNSNINCCKMTSKLFWHSNANALYDIVRMMAGALLKTTDSMWRGPD